MLVGDSYRIKECPNCIGMGNSNAVQITRKEDGFVWNCFRCMKVPGQKHAGFVPDKNVSPKQAMELINNVNKKKENTRPQVVVLPTDITYTLPPKALVQLYDNQIMDIDMQAHEIGWSPSHARIIIPLFKYGNGPGGWAKKLIGYLGRKIDGEDQKEKPKWYSVRQRDIKHPRFIALPKSTNFKKEVTIVEDVFSAIRIAATGHMSMGLLTTYLPYELYPKLRGWKVNLWLDADAFTKSVKYQASLGVHGITARTIMTMLDPKAYDDDDIKRIIHNGGI